MNTVFTYNQEEAAQIGGGSYLTKSGGYDFKVISAKFTNSQNSQARFLEMDLETREGLKCNYVSINFLNGQGQANEYGSKMINAIMGVTGIQQLNELQDGSCPNLIGANFKAVVQRVDYTKNNNEDGYKFEFKLPAHISTGKTVKEQLDGQPASSFEKYASTIEDKDERTQQAQNHQAAQHGMNHQSPQYSSIPEEFDDSDIPF